MVVISLTDREQTLLSDSVLTMIENAGQRNALYVTLNRRSYWHTHQRITGIKQKVVCYRIR